jgi:DNA-binding transcriptional ArsR family regulator
MNDLSHNSSTSGGSEDTCDVLFVDEHKVRAVKDAMKPDAVFAVLAETFKTLSDPTRVKILYALSLGELCVCDIANLLGKTSSAVSHQLRLLRSQKLVKFRKAGKIAYYSLDDEHIHHLLMEGLKHAEE